MEVEKSQMRQVARSAAAGAVTGICLGAPQVLAQSLVSVSKVGSEFFDCMAFVSFFPALLLLPTAGLSLVLLAVPRARRTALRALVFSSLAVGAFVVTARLSGEVRSRAFAKVASRSEPLIQAIREYEASRGTPPADLSSLVPEFLPEVPGTGLPRYPAYEYHSGERARVYGDRWAVTVPCPLGFLNWDVFYYVPSMEYPQLGHGNYIERIGDWAYVHE